MDSDVGQRRGWKRKGQPPLPITNTSSSPKVAIGIYRQLMKNYSKYEALERTRIKSKEPTLPNEHDDVLVNISDCSTF